VQQERKDLLALLDKLAILDPQVRKEFLDLQEALALEDRKEK
jgi:hypothetical protein